MILWKSSAEHYVAYKHHNKDILEYIFDTEFIVSQFLAVTKQLYEWFSPSVCLSVRPSHLFDYVPLIISSWNVQEWLPVTKATSMQKFKVRGQRSSLQRSKLNSSISGL